jgi:hypothetical protein
MSLSEFIESQRYCTPFGILPLLIEVAKNGVIAIKVFHKHGVLHFVGYLVFKPCYLYPWFRLYHGG